MAHFALLDENNNVVAVFVGRDDDDEQELTARTGDTYKKTSYNTFAGYHKLGGTPFRKNYAGIGYVYDPERDAFIPPKPYPSWVLNDWACIWEPPVPFPSDYGAPGVSYRWDEDTISWRNDTAETPVESV